MDINALIMFYKVAETNNFSKASKILEVPISTLSRKINKLEADLNQKLFIRNTRKVSLTLEGKILYEQSKPIFEELYNLPNIFEKEGDVSGEIRITSTIEHKCYLAPKVVQFRQLYPNINLFLHFSNDIKDLLEDSYDFAFRAGNLIDSSLYSYTLYKENLSAYIYKQYYNSGLEQGGLQEFDYCVMENNTLLHLNNGETFKPKKRVVSNSIHFIQEYAKFQASIIYVPDSHAQHDFIKLNTFKSKESSFNLVYLHKNLNKPCRLFLEFFKQFKYQPSADK